MDGALGRRPAAAVRHVEQGAPTVVWHGAVWREAAREGGEAEQAIGDQARLSPTIKTETSPTSSSRAVAWNRATPRAART